MHYVFRGLACRAGLGTSFSFGVESVGPPVGACQVPRKLATRSQRSWNALRACKSFCFRSVGDQTLRLCPSVPFCFLLVVLPSLCWTIVDWWSLFWNGGTNCSTRYLYFSEKSAWTRLGAPGVCGWDHLALVNVSSVLVVEPQNLLLDVLQDCRFSSLMRLVLIMSFFRS